MAAGVCVRESYTQGTVYLQSLARRQRQNLEALVFSEYYLLDEGERKTALGLQD